jgi:hypothetical protein
MSHPPAFAQALRTALAVATAVGLSACSTHMTVTRIATDGDTPAWQLQGTEITPLRVHAQRLCPSGYTVLQRFERLSQAGDPDSFMSRMRYQASYRVGNQVEPDARLTIVCKPFDDPEPVIPKDIQPVAPASGTGPDTMGG